MQNGGFGQEQVNEGRAEATEVAMRSGCEQLLEEAATVFVIEMAATQPIHRVFTVV